MNYDLSEEWRPVVGFEGLYRVSNLGRIWSEGRKVEGRKWPQSRPARMLRPTLNDKGYPVVSLYPPHGRSKVVCVHQLVAAAFIGPRPDGMEVCHCDGDPRNAQVSNLRYDTHSGNMLDAMRHGTVRVRKGEDHLQAKLTASAVLAIKADNRTQKEIAADYGISRCTVGRVKRGKTWLHLTGEAANGL